MYLNQNLNQVAVACINLSTRKDRRTRMNLQAKNHKLPVKFFTMRPHSTDPKRGCLESHLHVIETFAKNKNNKYLLILEDDAKIIRPLTPFPAPPTDWDLLYLGGTIYNNMGPAPDAEGWSRVATWTCHAYIINLTNEALVKDILLARNQEKELDEYMIKNIHHQYKTYMINPMRVIQRDGYSDIEKGKVEYSFMEDTLRGFRQPIHEKLTNGDYVLKLDFVPPELLPQVSIITPTYNRRKIFPLALHNFENFNYPPEKLEWIIIDDSTDENNSVKDLIPKNDPRIKYIYLKSTSSNPKDRMSVAQKRNYGVREAKYPYIIHMDDDDYYPKESIMARIKILMKYGEEGIECVGCSRVGVYDIPNNKSSIATDGIISLSEASMGYTRKFWEKQQFNELEREGEYKSFIQGRFNKIMDIPYSFVIYALTHKSNFTGMTKRIDKNVLKHKDTGEDLNFYDQWDEETQFMIDSIRKVL